MCCLSKIVDECTNGDSTSCWYQAGSAKIRFVGLISMIIHTMQVARLLVPETMNVLSWGSIPWKRANNCASNWANNAQDLSSIIATVVVSLGRYPSGIRSQMGHTRACRVLGGSHGLYFIRQTNQTCEQLSKCARRHQHRGPLLRCSALVQPMLRESR